MKLFGISDLHLSFSNPKPMEIFGIQWKNHFEKIENNWKKTINDSNIVLIPGDISWALTYNNVLLDLQFISTLPGKKVIIKGNHDYWWQSISKLREESSNNLYFIQNDTLKLNEIVISGTRLWDYPFNRWEDSAPIFELDEGKFDNDKIRRREIERLKMCLSKMQKTTNSFKIILTHFPPIGSNLGSNIITDLLTEHNVDLCVFGHLHDLPKNQKPPVDCIINKTRYVLVSCDYIDFKPKLICEI